jgi:hypothetical protein
MRRVNQDVNRIEVIMNNFMKFIISKEVKKLRTLVIINRVEIDNRK